MPRRTKRAPRRQGAGLKDMLKKAHDYVKEKKLISKVVGELGYGRPKRKRAPAKKGGFIGGLFRQIAKPVGHWAVDKLTGGSLHRGGSRVMGLGNVYDPTPRGMILA